MSSNRGSGAYSNVLGGGLRLKGKPSLAPASRLLASNKASTTLSSSSSSSPYLSLSGNKRKFSETSFAKVGESEVGGVDSPCAEQDAGRGNRQQDKSPTDDSISVREEVQDGKAGDAGGLGCVDLPAGDDKRAESAAGDSTRAQAAAGTGVVDRRTAAQKAYDEAMERRREELARKAVSKTHRQRVEDLNKLLATTPVHGDLFKISYAGIG